MISIQGIVDAYEFLYDQPPNAWTFELDVRTSLVAALGPDPNG